MGLYYKTKLVLLDEEQLKWPLAIDLDTLLMRVYDFIGNEVDGFDDVDIDDLDVCAIVSERLNAAVEFDGYKGSEFIDAGFTWKQTVSNIMKDKFALPPELVTRFLDTGCGNDIKDWLEEGLNTGKSYRAGDHRIHEDILLTYSDGGFPGFYRGGVYYDSYNDSHCDARENVESTGLRLIVELKHIIGE